MTRRPTIAAPPRFVLGEQTLDGVTLAGDGGQVVRIFVLEDHLIRVLVLPHGELDQPRSWAIAPGQADVALEGRDRLDLAGFALPPFTVTAEAETLVLETAALRLSVGLSGFFCAWEMRLGQAWIPIARDRPTQAYDFGYWDGRPRHYLRREPHERYFGLGERSGPLDRAGRRFRLSNLDAMGYDAATSDPLYKHFPVYLTARPPTDQTPAHAFGLLYDTLADCSFDFGQELDNYHGPYRGFVADHGDLDYYVIAGPGLEAAVRRLTWLTGRPCLLPRWGLGYSGSTMAYTDAPDAQARMAGFLEGCGAHDILCDSFHLSSGYTSIGDRRHVFHWNRDKFPDPRGFAQGYADRGVRLCANIKPCLLADNPRFAQAQASGLLLTEPDGAPAWSQFWDGAGVYLDFTQPAAEAWWRARVTDALLDQGIAATWNDNNEYEVWSATAQAHNFGAPRPARELKPLQTLLMMRASRQAQVDHAPQRRPFVVSRSGGLGMQRYAQTWSGDNVTAWKSLKYNLPMGLGLALSGVSNSGHDIGGFAGPAPDPELFVRWVQMGVFLPRFSIHSWNEDGTVNEPWMHPEVTATVRDLIRLRYRLIPYLYDLGWRHHAAFEPITRPTLLDFPDDPACWAANDDFMLGANLLVAPVVEPGQTERRLHLPAGCAWWDVWTGEALAGGQTITRPAPWDQPVMLARAGGVIPINLADQHFGQPADQRGLLLFPPLGEGRFTDTLFDDDGEAWPGASFSGWRVEAEADGEAVRVRIEGLGALSGAPSPKVILPAGEGRRLVAVS